MEDETRTATTVAADAPVSSPPPIVAPPSDMAALAAQAAQERALAPAPTRQITTDQLADMGFITPVADPNLLREAFAYRQKLIAAILDPDHDFLYTVAYEEGNGQNAKKKEYTTTVYADARKYEQQYHGRLKALPKKSGVTKLAAALGIRARVLEQKGLPLDKDADYAWVLYEVEHIKSGKREIGQGICTADERPGRWMPKHHILSIADTRAYARAVLRIAGFGEVGAEELSIPEEDFGPLQIVAEVPPAAIPAKNAASRDANALDAGRNGQAQQQPARQQPAAQQQPKPAQQPAPANQSSQTSQQAKPAPASDPDVITVAQAKALSQQMLTKLGSKEKAVEWLKENAKVDKSTAVKEADYQRLMGLLEKIQVP